MAGMKDSCKDTTRWFVEDMLFCSHNLITQKPVFGDVCCFRQKYAVGSILIAEIK